MDTLPKNPSGDLSSFSGSYPEEQSAPAGPPMPTNTAQSAPPQAPFVTEPVTTTEPPPQAPAYPDFSQSASLTPTTGYDNPFGSPSADASAGAGASAPVPPTENPFTYQVGAPPAAPPRGNGKKILLLILLLLLLLGIGFVAFTSIGKLLSKNQPIVLNYWGLWENEQLLTPLVEEYQKSHPNIQIAYTKQSIKQYRERLQAAIGRGEGPDIFRYHSTWLPMLKDDVAPAGKTGYTAEEFKQTFYPVAAQDLVYANQVYGVPLMIDGLGLYYNEDLLRSAGVTPPTSWEEFRQATLSLTVKDQNGQIVTAGAALGTTGNVEHFSDILAVMMLQNGADLKNPVSNEAQQALSFYHLFAEKPNNVWDETLDNSILAFANGKVAFIFAPSWQAFTIKETNPQLKFQIIPIPQLPGTNVTWATYWAEGVSSKSTHKDEAWEFLKFLSSKDSLVKLHTEEAKTRAFGEPYSRVDLAQTLINDPLVGAYIRQAPTAQSFFLSSRTFDNGINDRMIKYLEDAVNSLTRSVSPQAALQTAAQGFAQVLSSFGFATAAPPAQK